MSTVGGNLREKHNSDFDFVGFEGVKDLPDEQLHALKKELMKQLLPAKDEEVLGADEGETIDQGT